VFHGVEVSEGSVLVHDTGDFVDDYRVDSRLRNDRSFLFVLVVDSDGGTLVELRLHPVEIGDCAVHEATGEAARWCRRTMRDRSEPYGTTFHEEDGTLVVPIDGRLRA
jgi:poly-gamma-glutamate synthesis protein (capsule biosynthesis protein)